MKKLYALLAAATFLGGNAMAADGPQFPNADFEGAWNTCKPWTSNNDTKTIGQNPESWCIANVAGYKVAFLGYMGATQVGKNVEGYNSTSAVQVYNSANPIATSQIVPGYVSLGTTWNTANTSAKESDGGTFGGISFTGRPKSITFMYKRTHGTENAQEQATVVAYLWKGEFQQAAVPGQISNSPKTVTMVDRDRNILGMETAKGGEVTQNGTLIAKINHAIAGDAEDWTECTIPFEYVSDETPEKANVIFCAGDYFSTTPGKDNNLTIDNVKLNYDDAEQPVDPQPGDDVTVVDTKTYTGLLTVTLGTEEPQEINGQNVFMDQLSNGNYRLRLENFGATDEEPEGMGSIVIDVTNNNGVLNGHSDSISLLGGAIEATADVNGTLQGNDLQLKIDVVWTEQPDVPIAVTFNGKADSDAIANIESDNAVAEYYNLNGVRVDGSLAPGVYVKRQGNKVVKVLVK